MKENILNSLENIVRCQGDLTLNIFDFYNKLASEIERNGVKTTSKINEIPEYILEQIVEVEGI
jgi:hypothetical protein